MYILGLCAGGPEPAFFARPEPELELPFKLQLVRQNKDSILQE